MQTRLPWKRPRTGPPKGAEDEAHGGNGADGTRDRAGDGEAPITNGGAVRDVERSQDPPPVDGDPPPARADPATGSTGSADAPAPAPKPPPVIVPRWVQLVVLPIALLGLWALARASGTVLLILITASIIALIINPLVKVLERRRVPRGLAILVVYLGFFAILAGIGLLLSNPISTQVTRFQRDVPQLVSHANKDLASFQRWLDRRGIRIHIQQQGQTALQTLQKNVLKRSGAIVSFSRDLLTQIVTIGFDLVLILVLSIYLLVYGRQIGDLVRKIMPAGDGTPEDDYPLLVQHAVFGYVRGQVLFSLIMGASASLALWIFGVVGIFPAGADYGVFFGAFYGLMEFIPYIGPIIGPAPAVLVALFNNPISAVWVVLLFLALQQLEGHLVAPQVFRISLRINPIVIILSLLIGYQIYGIVGALVALPVAAVVRQTVVYLRRHLVLEQWSLVSPGVGVPPAGSVISGEQQQPPSVVTPLDSEHCAECGATTQAEDSFCRTCGASLTPRVQTPG